jgi:hypothetical protein
MNMSSGDLRKLALDLPADHPGRTTVLRDLSVAAETATPKPATPVGPNGWERQYAEHLDALKRAGEVLWWSTQAVRVRIGDGAFFKPDFLVVWRDGRTTVDEVKGHEREAAVVRFKAAAMAVPVWGWRMLRRQGGAWVVTREIGPLLRKAA